MVQSKEGQASSWLKRQSFQIETLDCDTGLEVQLVGNINSCAMVIIFRNEKLRLV